MKRTLSTGPGARWARMLVVTCCLLALGPLLLPRAATAAPAGCTVTGEAYGVNATAGALLNARTARVVLPPGGTNTVASVAALPLATSGTITASTADISTTSQAIATSSATLENVNLLTGLITATSVRSEATSTSDGQTASSSPAGTTFTNLIGNGVAQSGTTANVDVPLVGLGFVRINEQIPTGNGTTTTGLTVNALHVFLTTAAFGLPAGAEIIIASASSGASCTAPLPTATAIGGTAGADTPSPAPAQDPAAGGGSTNRPPDARPDTVTTRAGTPVTLNVLANDSDPDGDRLEVVFFGQGSNGTVSCTRAGECTYTPNQGFVGTDSFPYAAGDPSGDTRTVRVTVLVEPAPEATATAVPTRTPAPAATAGRPRPGAGRRTGAERLLPSGEIGGVITDAPSGAPLPGASVTVTDASGTVVATLTADPGELRHGVTPSRDVHRAGNRSGV